MGRGGAVLSAAGRRRTRPPRLLPLQPMQPGATAWDSASGISAYAYPGALILLGRDNYANPAFVSAAATGATCLLYIDALLDNPFGRYHDKLYNVSEFGAAVPRWPGNIQINEFGYLSDFRVGSLLLTKLPQVLELAVAENPHIGGFFADDLGSRCWYAPFSWDTRSTADQQAWRDGAIAVAQAFRTVADKYGLIVLHNNTWNSGTLAANGGGYPTMTAHGCSLADGGVVEYHDGESMSFWTSYATGTNWATTAVTEGAPVMVTIGRTDTARPDWAATGVYAYRITRDQAGDPPSAPWGSFHPNGLPSRTNAPSSGGGLPSALIDLDANSVSGTNGSSVATFPDVSGNGRNFTQTNGADQPTLTTAAVNGKKALRFNSKFMSNTATGISGQTSFTVFFVMAVHSIPFIRAGVLTGRVTGDDYDQTTGAFSLSEPAATGATSFASMASSGSLTSANDANLGSVSAAFGTYVVIGVEAGVDGAALTLYVNGATRTGVTGRSVASLALSTLYLGGRHYGGAVGDRSDISIARMRLYGGRLSPTARATVTADLGSLYGITVT